MINDYAIAGILGVVIVYLLYFTGTDYYVIKGLSVGLLFWLFYYGIILRSQIARIDPTSPETNITALVWHLILGVTTSWIIIKCNKEIFEK